MRILISEVPGCPRCANTCSAHTAIDPSATREEGIACRAREDDDADWEEREGLGEREGRVVLVSFQDVRNFRYERIVRVWIREQRADAQQYFRYRQRRRPLFLENVETNCALIIHVRMVHLCLEGHLRRLKRIIRWEMDLHKEDATLVRAGRRAHNCGLPLEKVVLDRPGAARRWWIFLEILLRPDTKKEKERVTKKVDMHRHVRAIFVWTDTHTQTFFKVRNEAQRKRERVRVTCMIHSSDCARPHPSIGERTDIHNRPSASVPEVPL